MNTHAGQTRELSAVGLNKMAAFVFRRKAVEKVEQIAVFLR
jgi:hypothetical protein